MAFVFITQSVDSTIELHQGELNLVKKARSIADNLVLKNKQEVLEQKLNLLNKYNELVESRGAYEKIKHLKFAKPKVYAQKCKEICKSIKGVCFRENTGTFCVRLTINGKRKYLGEVDTPQDALDIIEMYL